MPPRVTLRFLNSTGEGPNRTLSNVNQRFWFEVQAPPFIEPKVQFSVLQTYSENRTEPNFRNTREMYCTVISLFVLGDVDEAADWA
jgi:hypothetical protein